MFLLLFLEDGGTFVAHSVYAHLDDAVARGVALFGHDPARWMVWEIGTGLVKPPPIPVTMEATSS
jgi:hypothetical protein